MVGGVAVGTAANSVGSGGSGAGPQEARGNRPRQSRAVRMDGRFLILVALSSLVGQAARPLDVLAVAANAAYPFESGCLDHLDQVSVGEELEATHTGTSRRCRPTKVGKGPCASWSSIVSR
jgi:hypothetical protein